MIDILKALHEVNPYSNFDKTNMNVDLSGWIMTTPDKDIFKQLIEEIKPKLIIEIGTWKGASAIYMAKIIKEMKLDCKILCIDTWLGSVEFWLNKNIVYWGLGLKNGYPTVYYQFLYNVIFYELTDIIIPLPNTSTTTYRWLCKKKINADLIFIDGSHDYNDVYNDIKNYKTILLKNGIIFGDDYSKNWPEVKRAVDDYAKEHNIEIETILKYWIYK